jgi:hypothetical protein
MTDEPWFDIEADMVCLDPCETLCQNEVQFWPSVGGVIIASKSMYPVELAFIEVYPFHINARSWNGGRYVLYEATQDRLEVAKCYNNFVRGRKSRILWPDEREVLFLGWPEHRGV